MADPSYHRRTHCPEEEPEPFSSFAAPRRRAAAARPRPWSARLAPGRPGAYAGAGFAKLAQRSHSSTAMRPQSGPPPARPTCKAGRPRALPRLAPRGSRTRGGGGAGVGSAIRSDYGAGLASWARMKACQSKAAGRVLRASTCLYSAVSK